MHWHKHAAFWLASTALVLLLALVTVISILNASHRAGIGLVEISPITLENHRAIHELQRLGDHSDVRAIVLDIRCPHASLGDLQAASEEIRNVKRRSKPIIAAIGDQMAGSGYIVACAADFIFANPGSLIQALAEDDTHGIPTSAVADLKEQLFAAVLESRSVATAGVMASEKNTVTTDIPPEAVRDRLRTLSSSCLTGRQAFKAGLVDKLGNVDDAIVVATFKAGLKGRVPIIQLRDFPDSRDPSRLRR